MTQLQQTNPLTANSMASLNAFLLSAGVHPTDELGWQIVYQFGKATATVFWTPDTKGIEMASNVWNKNFDYLTGREVFDLLVSLKNKYT